MNTLILLPLLHLFFFFNFFAANLHYAAAAAQCRQDQKNLLLSLKKTLAYDSSSSTKLSHWTESADCCTWAGVKCDGEGYPSALDLTGESISGGVDDSSSLFKLVHLRNLSLAQNSFGSTQFPRGFAKLQALEYLYLGGSGFSGEFPPFVADFPSLKVLDMSSCALSGVVPSKLFLIPTLESVDLSNSRELKGTLPEFPSKGSLLQSLQLSYTMFSGELPRSIANLNLLSTFDLRACSFHGPIPINSFEKLTSLRYVDLSLNQFSGPLPSFASLKNLQVINLRRNNLTGVISDGLWKGLDSLNFLDLSENLLQGDVPLSLFTLPSLSVLNLSNNRFSGSLREGPISSSSLESIDLSGNFLQGRIPRFFFRSHNLTSLNLARNMFSDSLDLKDLGELTVLASLDLSHNDLSISVSEDIPISKLFPRLNSLMLSSCKVRTFPPLENHPSLMMLDLSENLLQGEIPSWVWEVGNGFLRFLNLSNNHFAHLQEPYDFRHVQFLDLHSNSLTGPIPVSLSAAAYIDFSRNKFTSSLPSNVVDLLTRAYFFSVANNQLSGTIPSSICNATNLQVLDLSYNNFHGSVPSCLCKKNSSKIRVIGLRSNKFLGGNVGCVSESSSSSSYFSELKFRQGKA